MYLAEERDRMVRQHLRARGIRDPDVLDAMHAVPREKFVEPGSEEFAYLDSPLPIGERQTISQPYIVARMAEAAELSPADRVLEVGTGSGYAAAIYAQEASEVFTIERHASLARQARKRFVDLGYTNIDVREGDGKEGWESQAPFDAILIAAAAEVVPPALLAQLAIDGRLVMPVGKQDNEQDLLRITRKDSTTYETKSLGGVRFVPLLDGVAVAPSSPERPLSQRIADAATELPPLDTDAFADTFARYAQKRVVLLGESTHGTHEFYRARAAISRLLIEEHGFDFVAVEADWPDAAVINRYINGEDEADGVQPFRRFPRWMWRNAEFAAFIAWMRTFNETRQGRRPIGFHGLDLYNMQGAVDAVLAYLDRNDPQAAGVARSRYGCLTPWQKDPASYGAAALTPGYRNCEAAVVRQCRDLLERQLTAHSDGAGLMDAVQSARLVAAAERYYRVMYYGGSRSWNLRDSHMADTLQQLLDHYGPGSRGIVWAHNSHVGDARHTDLGMLRNEHSLGQLTRDRYQDAAALIGFGTAVGSVFAADDWDGNAELKGINPPLPDSIEDICQQSLLSPFLLDLQEGVGGALEGDLRVHRPQRFIGVVYRSDTERQSHYANAALKRQYDGYLWFKQTKGVTPLGVDAHFSASDADTYPSGL